MGWSFFFQAEDGIRDYKVTGVQTCALPIYDRPLAGDLARRRDRSTAARAARADRARYDRRVLRRFAAPRVQIGRASCRERVKDREWVVGMQEKQHNWHD